MSERGIPIKSSRVIKHFLIKLATIALTIVVGVYITIVVANRNGAIDEVVRRDMARDISKSVGIITVRNISQIRWSLEELAGLHLPQPWRDLRWTYNALTFQWGSVKPQLPTEDGDATKPTSLVTHGNLSSTRHKVANIIAEYFPNTLLIICAADLIVFLVGIPLALYLSQRPKKWLDRLVVLLSPIASVPSWVHGIILVLIFSLWLHILPSGGMYDVAAPPATIWGQVAMVAKHMILPVTAILLSLFLQCVTAWRTFFLLYSNEDYVELGIAKGLPSRKLGREYIMRPTLPYVITSFALTLVGFWQMTTALEYFFRWPGIGFLYVECLNTMDMIVAVGIVVVFAYLLSIVVLLLDFAYVLVDPRIRLMKPRERSRLLSRKGGIRQKVNVDRQHKRDFGQKIGQKDRETIRLRLKTGFARSSQAFSQWRRRVASFTHEFMRMPSAVTGSLIILCLVGLSICAPLVANASQRSESWDQHSSREPVLPRNGAPLWVNLFRKNDLPPSMVLSSQDGTAQKSVQLTPEGFQITITFEIDYPYGEIPQDINLLFISSHKVKRPFIAVSWIYPDGREVAFGGNVVVDGQKYILSEHIPGRFLSSHGLYGLEQILDRSTGGANMANPLLAIFTNPTTGQPSVMQGTYSIRLDCLTFEESADFDAELVLIGQAYGLAGTDHQRRDLLVPLLWGAPVALLIGMAGAVLTTFVSILVAAISAWFGGWVDGLIQRMTEVIIILPFLAIGVLLMSLFGISLWIVLALIIVLMAFGSPVKVYRSAFLQARETAYIEAAQAYGASNWRVISHYMLPRIVPVLIPQLVILIPGFVFLEATLSIFGVSKGLPTWGNMIYLGLRSGAMYGNLASFMLPVMLLVLAGLGFALLGSALERILNPSLQDI